MENDPHHTNVMPRDFTLHFLEEITNKFSKDRIIGYGGYGVVYKARLLLGSHISNCTIINYMQKPLYHTMLNKI